MPYREPEPDDPHELRGVVLDGNPGSTRAMAESFADEFAGMGFGRERILALFRNPFYAGAHRAFRELGEDAVVCVVDESVRVLGTR